MQYKGLVTIGDGKIATYTYDDLVEADNLPQSVGQFCLTPPRLIDRLESEDEESDLDKVMTASLRDMHSRRSPSPIAGPSNRQALARAAMGSGRRSTSPRRGGQRRPWEDEEWHADRFARPLTPVPGPSRPRPAGRARRAVQSPPASAHVSDDENTVVGDGSPP